MNIRIAFAALVLALSLGDARANLMEVEGEQCLIPDASYVHVGILNDRDRYYWVWCVTRFNRYWSMSLDPLDRTFDVTFSVGKNTGDASFMVHWPPIGWGEPATEALESAARNSAANDTHRPPIPPWKVQTNGKSTTRPGYVISEGKRSTTAASERVTVGVACDCRSSVGRAIEGKSVYCVVPGVQTPLLGALCTPGEPTVPPPTPPVTPPEPPVTPPTPPTGTWTKIAGEGGSFTVGTSQRVRFGKDAKWVEKTVTGTGQCTNGFFGIDPAIGVTKQCDLWSASPVTPPVITPPATGPGATNPTAPPAGGTGVKSGTSTRL